MSRSLFIACLAIDETQSSRPSWRETESNRSMWKNLLLYRTTSALILVVCASLIFGGCSSSAPPEAASLKVDPEAAAAEAIRIYDANGNGVLEELELGKCPAIKNALDRYDKDGNHQISQEEISQRLKSLFSSSVGLLELQCAITRSGRPLSGATVRFIPEPFLGAGLQTATATTDDDGLASPKIPTDQLPDRLRNAPLMQVGLYRVEVEHPSLPTDQAKQLGFEIDPTRRGGTNVRFDL